MEKKDLVYLAAAIGVVLVVALIAKPALTGEKFPDLPLYFIHPQPTPTVTPITPSPTPRPVAMVPFATLSGNRSGTTETIRIPFSYWDISYSAEPVTSDSTNETLIFPRLKIQIVDAENTSRIVRNIEPDLLDARINTSYDPRPWKDRIEEGYHQYYFVVHIQEVSSYRIDILIPQEQ
jgi:hypothetical protein